MKKSGEVTVFISLPPGTTSYMTPYTYAALPQAAAGLPAAAAAAAAAGGFPGLNPYQSAAAQAASLQDTRLQ